MDIKNTTNQINTNTTKPVVKPVVNEYETAMLKAMHDNKDFVQNILTAKKRVKKAKDAEDKPNSLKAQANKDFTRYYNRLMFVQDNIYKPIYRLLVYGVHQQKDEQQKLAAMAKAKELLKTFVVNISEVMQGKKDKELPDRT